jgi:ketosteroid isomerase-like protein
MSRENVEIVRREYVAFAAGDWQALAEIWHSDTEYETYESLRMPGPIEASTRQRASLTGGGKRSRSSGSKSTR